MCIRDRGGRNPSFLVVSDGSQGPSAMRMRMGTDLARLGHGLGPWRQSGLELGQVEGPRQNGDIAEALSQLLDSLVQVTCLDDDRQGGAKRAQSRKGFAARKDGHVDIE